MAVDKEAKVVIVAHHSPAAGLPITPLTLMTIRVHMPHIIESISRCPYRIQHIIHGKTSLLIATLFRTVMASGSTEVCLRLHKITKSLELQTVIL